MPATVGAGLRSRRNRLDVVEQHHVLLELRVLFDELLADSHEPHSGVCLADIPAQSPPSDNSVRILLCFQCHDPVEHGTSFRT